MRQTAANTTIRDTRIKLRAAAKPDLSLLLPMVQAYHEFEGISLNEEQREHALCRLLTNPSRGGIWLILLDNQTVGYIVLCIGYSIEFCGTDAFIDEFYITPEYRGQGIGNRTLELIKPLARDLGIKALHLEVARHNQYAQGLYQRADFKSREKYVLMSVLLD